MTEHGIYATAVRSDPLRRCIVQSIIIDSVEEVAVKEIVVSIVDSSVSSIPCSFPESIVRQVVRVTAYQTKRIRGSPGGWLDFSDEPTNFIPLQTDLSFFNLITSLTTLPLIFELNDFQFYDKITSTLHIVH